MEGKTSMEYSYEVNFSPGGGRCTRTTNLVEPPGRPPRHPSAHRRRKGGERKGKEEKREVKVYKERKDMGQNRLLREKCT